MVEKEKKINVLFVDDTKYLGLRYLYTFEGTNIQPFFSINVDMMTSILYQEKIDVVVLDYHFANCDYNGYELAKFVKAFNKDIQIIIISGHLNENIIEEFSKININQFIAKPFTNQELLKEIRKITSFQKEEDKHLWNFVFVTETLRDTILLIENNSQMCRLYKMYLEDRYDIVEAKTMREIAVISSKNYNIKMIILDYGLENEDFEQILDYVNSNFKNAKRILVTGYHDIDYLNNQYGKYFNAIIKKPTDFSFKNRIIELIETK